MTASTMIIVRKIYISLIIALLFVIINGTACTEATIPWKTSKITDSIAGDYLSARFAQKINESNRAVKYYTSALAKDPHNKDLLKKGIGLMLTSGDIKEAIILADRYSKEGGTSPEAALLLALDKIKQHDFHSAEETLNSVEVEKITDIGTTSELVVPLLKVWTIAGQGDYSLSLQILKERGNIGLESFIKYQMALVHDMAGNKAEAKELFDDLNEGAAKSLRLTEVMANFYQRNGDKEKVEKIIADFVENNPGLTAEAFLYNKTPVMQSAIQGASELLLEVASFLYSNRLDDMAQGYTYMSLYLTPDFPHAKLLMAKLLKEQERYDEAIATLKAITYPPYFHWQARLNVARIYHKLDRYKEAEELLSSMASQDPKDKDALLTLGDVQMDRKDYESAIHTYDKALARSTNEDRNDWVIYYARGICYERSDQWDKAEDDLFKSLEMKPNQPDVLNYLGYSWLMMNKNIDQAKEMLETAIALRPNDAHIIDSYGWALYKLGDYNDSVKYLEKSNLIMPHDATTNDHLGDVYWRLGRINEAYFQWKRALIFEPADEDKINIEAKLKNGLENAPLAAAEKDKKGADLDQEN